jgi:putative Mg2+ transporter-C (MgtC) family protein
MNWLTGNWHTLLGEPWLSCVLVLTSAFCGYLVGCERERHQKPTGMRTLMLVSIGTTVFTMLSFGSALELGEHGRIAAQIVTGIGFLGAGAIIHGKFGVTGLTSAASLWAVAAMSMAIGAGYVGAGVALSLLILGVLSLVARWEQRFVGSCRYTTASIIFETDGGKTLIKIHEILDEFAIPTASRISKLEQIDDHTARIEIRYCDMHKRHREFLGPLVELREIQKITTHPAHHSR